MKAFTRVLLFMLGVVAIPAIAQTGQRYNVPYTTAFDTTGIVSPGAQLFFYLTGTSTPATTYANSTLTSANANPVVANGAGLFGNIFLVPGTSYKVVLEDSSNNMIWTADPVNNGSGIYITPQAYGAACTATNGSGHDDTAAFIAAGVAAVAANSTLAITGKCVISNWSPPANLSILGLGATIFMKTGATGTMIHYTSASMPHIQGTLTLDGGDRTVYDAMSVQGNRVGLEIDSGANGSIGTGLNLIGFTSQALYVHDLLYSNSGDSLTITGPQCRDSFYCINFGVRAEYISLAGGSATTSRYGFSDAGGNNTIAAFHADADVDCVSLTTGANDGHGTWTGGSMNHCGQYTLHADGVQNGFKFVGAQMFYSVALIEGSNGIDFQDGEMGNVTVQFKGGSSPSQWTGNQIVDSTVFSNCVGGAQSYAIQTGNVPSAGAYPINFNNAPYTLASTTIAAAPYTVTTEQTILFTSPGSSIGYFGCPMPTAGYDPTTGIGTLFLPGSYTFAGSIFVTNLSSTDWAYGYIYIRYGSSQTPIFQAFNIPPNAVAYPISISGTIGAIAGQTFDTRIAATVGSFTLLATAPSISVVGPL